MFKFTNKDELLNFLGIFTWVAVIIIIISFIASCAYIWYRRRNNKLKEHRQWVEQLPSLVSTLGVLGTFAGITLGLINFNEGDLENSIPLLLNGLKTAFFTSLTGMIGSIILTRVVNNSFDKLDGGISDIHQASGEIVRAVQEMSEANRNTASDQRAFYNTANSVMATIGQDISAMRLQSQSQSTTLTKTLAQLETLTASVNNIDNTVQQTATALAAVNTVASRMEYTVGELLEHASTNATVQEEINEGIKGFGDKLHSEVLEIEDSMSKTNVLLEAKFTEFTELLKKSNTEALVEVMKKVTEEFQRQMNDLISRLVQENFQQLNQSVERLNTWQQENKEMISSLTEKYREMAKQFAGTEAVLTKVGLDTQNLVSDGGKLKQLIESLKSVLVEDTKFKEITQNLTSTVELTKSNMQKFDESTGKLNEWVRKQRDFVDGVNALIVKLDELNKIRDYGEQFWLDTKKHMEEGVGIIREGSTQLNQQLTSLDRQFYNRLSATLAELDACIQALVRGRNRG